MFADSMTDEPRTRMNSSKRRNLYGGYLEKEAAAALRVYAVLRNVELSDRSFLVGCGELFFREGRTGRRRQLHVPVQDIVSSAAAAALLPRSLQPQFLDGSPDAQIHEPTPGGPGRCVWR